MEKLDISVRSEQKGTPMTDTTSNTAVLDTAFAGLETRDTHAWFGSHHALAGVSLQFPARSVTGLIGPSGCGKSTYLRLLNRMHEFIPTAALAGEVLLDGKEVGRVTSVTQDYESGPLALAVIKRSVPTDAVLTAGTVAASQTVIVE